jgi:hypothetical protein
MSVGSASAREQAGVFAPNDDEDAAIDAADRFFLAVGRFRAVGAAALASPLLLTPAALSSPGGSEGALTSHPSNSIM